MTVAHAFLGFIIGQIITLEGVRLERLMTYLLSLLLVYLFTVLPLFALLHILHQFNLQTNPIIIISIVLLLNKGLICLLYFIDTTRQPIYY